MRHLVKMTTIVATTIFLGSQALAQSAWTHTTSRPTNVENRTVYEDVPTPPAGYVILNWTCQSKCSQSTGSSTSPAPYVSGFTTLFDNQWIEYGVYWGGGPTTTCRYFVQDAMNNGRSGLDGWTKTSTGEYVLRELGWILYSQDK